SILLVGFTIVAACSILWCSCKQRGASEGEPRVSYDLRALRGALLSYKSEYNTLPMVTPQTQEQNNAEIVGVLRASASEELLSKYNPKRKAFLQVPSASLGYGGFLDPWGHAYHVCFDINDRGKITVGNEIVATDVAIWSN